MTCASGSSDASSLSGLQDPTREAAGNQRETGLNVSPIGKTSTPVHLPVPSDVAAISLHARC